MLMALRENEEEMGALKRFFLLSASVPMCLVSVDSLFCSLRQWVGFTFFFAGLLNPRLPDTHTQGFLLAFLASCLSLTFAAGSTSLFLGPFFFV